MIPYVVVAVLVALVLLAVALTHTPKWEETPRVVETPPHVRLFGPDEAA